MTFLSEFTASASKYIRKLDTITKRRIEDRVNKLEENPFPQDIERVGMFENELLFRVRVGDQRILYIVRKNQNKLIIVKVDKRSRVYD